jgi:hypothetical protein
VGTKATGTRARALRHAVDKSPREVLNAPTDFPFVALGHSRPGGRAWPRRQPSHRADQRLPESKHVRTARMLVRHRSSSVADDAVRVNAGVPLPEALPFLWRGYADPASWLNPGPRVHAARSGSAEILSSPLVANSAPPCLQARS